MSEENERSSRRVLKGPFDKGNLDGVNELIHPEFVNREALPDNRQAKRFTSDSPPRWERSPRSS